MISVADTSPINYLVLIGEIDVLPAMYDEVWIPSAVLEELQDEATPNAVRTWSNTLPQWLKLRLIHRSRSVDVPGLGRGECEAIQLAEEIRADRIILDDQAARREAGRRNLMVIGTLGILIAAADRGLVDLRKSLGKLQRTNFYISIEMLESLLKRF